MKILRYVKYCFLVFPMLLVLGGCITTSQCKQEEPVPVYKKKVPPEFIMPEPQVKSLKKPYTTEQALKAAGSDYLEYKYQLEKCITILDGYR